MNRVRIINAHVLPGLAILPNESVHCAVTSPPYWGLRDYGLEPQVWGGDAGCEHEWGDREKSPWANKVPGPNGLQKNNAAGHWKPKQTGPFCRLCGAWLGSFGLEPTLDCLGWATGNPCGQCYICHSLQIYREVWRVLRKDGTFWLNIGDSYNGSGGAGGDYNKGGLKEGQPRFPGRNAPGLKPKDLCGVPQRLVLALQAEGWWWRSGIVWFKTNPWTESCKDRPTRTHEDVFLLTKSARYFYDGEAVKEKSTGQNGAAANFQRETKECLIPGQTAKQYRNNRKKTEDNGYRNLRTVWKIATARFPGPHFATFPPELVRPCVAAGTSEKGCCPKCGAAWKRVVEKIDSGRRQKMSDSWDTAPGSHGTIPRQGKEKGSTDIPVMENITTGWTPTCICTSGLAKVNPYTPVPCTVLDPFSGAGTTALVAAKLGRGAIGIELNPEYVEMSRKRLAGELGMLAEISVDTPGETAV